MHKLKKGKVYKDVFIIIHYLWKKLKSLSGVSGKAANTVLLNVRPQNIKDAKRIPSPIRFKPLFNFDNDDKECEIYIELFYDKEVINTVTGSNNTNHYDKLINKLRGESNEEVKSRIYDLFDNYEIENIIIE